jgi:hypothetical protein
MAGIIPGLPPLFEFVRNLMGACVSVGRATKNMYAETTIKAKTARNVVRCIFGLSGLPIANNADEIAGRLIVYAIGDEGREMTVAGKEERLFVRRCAIVLKDSIKGRRWGEQR